MIRGIGMPETPSSYAKDYEEICSLGEGAFGKVYLARHKLDSNEYAIKKIHIPAREFSEMIGETKEVIKERISKLLDEPVALAKLDHANIVRYYDSWIEAWPLSQKSLSQNDSSEDGSESEQDDEMESAKGSPEELADGWKEGSVRQILDYKAVLFHAT